MTDVPPIDPDHAAHVEAQVAPIRAEVSSLSKAVEKTNENVNALADDIRVGFAEQRRSVGEIYDRIAETKEASLTRAADNSGVSWPFVSLIIGASALIGGTLVSFVRMGDDYLRRDVDIITAHANEHSDDGHPYTVRAEIDALGASFKAHQRTESERIDALTELFVQIEKRNHEFDQQSAFDRGKVFEQTAGLRRDAERAKDTMERLLVGETADRNRIEALRENVERLFRRLDFDKAEP